LTERNDNAVKSLYASEADWLREFALFYGTGSTTRFSEDDLNDVSFVEIFEALADSHPVWCEKCDGPGTVCMIEGVIGDDSIIRVKVHFNSQEMILTVLKAEKIKDAPCDENNAA
jgi:hypothetical protein